MITRKRKYDPISDDLIELHWLPVEQRIDFKILVLTYKAIHHQSPDYISSMLQLRTDSRHLRSTSFAPQLVQPRTHHITFADRAFSCYAPRKWNQLPPQIRNANSIGIFKRLLKISSLWTCIWTIVCFFLLCQSTLVQILWFRRYISFIIVLYCIVL